MDNELKAEHWQLLAQQITTEHTSEKLSHLVKELCRELDRKNHRGQKAA